METWLHSAISTAWQVIAPSVREIRSILGQPPPSSFTPNPVPILFHGRHSQMGVPVIYC